MDVWVLHWRAIDGSGCGVLRVYDDEETGTEDWDLLNKIQDETREFFLDRFTVRGGGQ